MSHGRTLVRGLVDTDVASLKRHNSWHFKDLPSLSRLGRNARLWFCVGSSYKIMVWMLLLEVNGDCCRTTLNNCSKSSKPGIWHVFIRFMKTHFRTRSTGGLSAGRSCGTVRQAFNLGFRMSIWGYAPNPNPSSNSILIVFSVTARRKVSFSYFCTYLSNQIGKFTVNAYTYK